MKLSPVQELVRQNLKTITENEEPGKWSVYYFYPKDFTFICPTEIVGMDSLLSETLSKQII